MSDPAPRSGRTTTVLEGEDEHPHQPDPVPGCDGSVHPNAADLGHEGFRSGDQRGIGMGEHLDQVVDGRPVGPGVA